MTTCALGSTNVYNLNGIWSHQMLMTRNRIWHVIIVHDIIVIVITFYLNRGCQVAINTPSHRQFGILRYSGHFLNRTMTSLTSNLSNFHVLAVIKVNEILQVMHPHPFYRFWIITILLGAWIIIQCL